MNSSIIKLQIITVLLGLPLFFYFDSKAFNAVFPHGQWISNAIMVFFYAWFYWTGNKKIRSVLVIMVGVGLFFEVLCSLLLEIYTYRLDNIPIYVPLGHAVVFTTICYLQKEALMRKHAHWLQPLLYAATFLICFLSLLFLKDIYGFICFAIFLLLLRNRKNKLFYLLMFFMVLYLEVAGTQMGAWAWFSAIGKHPELPHIANPPAGMGSGYMILDMITSCIYVLLLKRIKSSKTKVLQQV